MKDKLKKGLFILALIPYIIFLILGVINCIKYTIDNQVLDLYELIAPLSDFWFDTIIEFNFIYVILIIFCVGYPIFYLVDKSHQKQEKLEKTKKFDKYLLLYILSFIPYLFLTYTCIFGIEFGFFTTDMYYGFDALLIALIAGTIIPIYPLILIYQIVYTLKQHKNFSNKLKKSIILMVILLVASIIIPSLVHLNIKNNRINNNYKQDKVIIEKYLSDTFGKHYDDMEVLKNNSESASYRIKTPLLDYSFTIELNRERNQVNKNTFYKEFVEENNMQDKFDRYITNLYNLPNNVKINSVITSFDINNYSVGDSIDNLLNTCEYKIDSIYIYDSNYKKEEILSIIKDYYKKYDVLLKPYYTKEWLMFYVKINDKNYASIQVITSNNNLTIHFSGYNYGDGYTIAYETEYIDLNN